MRRFRLTIEYDGTNFAGFQFQGQGERTVQGTLEAAIARLSGDKTVRIHGAGRTDAGVHATGQVVHFDTEWGIPVERIALALGGELPDDLTVRQASVAEAGFHSRFSATGRHYRYTILNRPVPSALVGRFAWHVRDTLDTDAMRAAAVHLTGIHDFVAFGQPAQPGKATVRRVDRVDVRRQGDLIRIDVEGNAFLKQMVRAFIGTLCAVGSGKIAPETVATLRDERDARKIPPIAPARGLCLVRVRYDGVRYEDKDDRNKLEELEL